MKKFAQSLQKVPTWAVMIAVGIGVYVYRLVKFNIMETRAFGEPFDDKAYHYINHYAEEDTLVWTFLIVLLYWLIKKALCYWETPKAERVTPKLRDGLNKGLFVRGKEKRGIDRYETAFLVASCVMVWIMLLWGKQYGVFQPVLGVLLCVNFALFGRLYPGDQPWDKDDRITRWILFGLMAVAALGCGAVMIFQPFTPRYQGDAEVCLYCASVLAAYLLFYRPSPCNPWEKLLKVLGYVMIIFVMVIAMDEPSIDNPRLNAAHAMIIGLMGLGYLLVWLGNWLMLRRMRKLMSE